MLEDCLKYANDTFEASIVRFRSWLYDNEEGWRAYKLNAKYQSERALKAQILFINFCIDEIHSSSFRARDGSYYEKDYTAPNLLVNIGQQINEAYWQIFFLPKSIKAEISEDLFDNYISSVRSFFGQISEIYPTWPDLRDH